MKKKHLYCISLALVVLSCNNSGTKQNLINENDSNITIGITDTTVINTDTTNIKKELSIPLGAIKVVNNETIRRDTIINNTHISYIIQDNNEIVMTDTGYEKLYYSGTEVLLNVRFPNGKTSHKKIERSLFYNFIPKEEINKYCITSFYISTVGINEISTEIFICIPDTDICYGFNITLNSEGESEITEIYLIYEED